MRYVNWSYLIWKFSYAMHSTPADISLNVLLITTLKENFNKPQSSWWLRKPFKKKIINVESQCDLYNPIKILENDRNKGCC